MTVLETIITTNSTLMYFIFWTLLNITVGGGVYRACPEGWTRAGADMAKRPVNCVIQFHFDFDTSILSCVFEVCFRVIISVASEICCD